GLRRRGVPVQPAGSNPYSFPMPRAPRRLRRTPVLAIAALVVATLAACAPEDSNSSSGNPAPTTTSESSGGETSAAPDPCAIDQLNLKEPGVLTIGTNSPAYPPWF